MSTFSESSRRQFLQSASSLICGATATVLFPRKAEAQGATWDVGAAQNALKLIYKRLLDRDVDPVGLDVHTRFLVNQNRTMQELALFICGSPEYSQKFISPVSADEAVRGLYRRLFNREPENQQVVQMHANNLRRKGIKDVLTGFGAEYRQLWGANGIPGIGYVPTRGSANPPSSTAYNFCVSSVYTSKRNRTIYIPGWEASSWERAESILRGQLGNLGAGDSWSISRGSCPN
jgi:hypothetical protein